MPLRLGKISLEFAALGIGLAVFLFGALQAGFIETLGFERDTRAFHTFVSTRSGGFGVGLKYFYLREGQVAFVDYDAEVRQGSLRLGLMKLGKGIGKGPHFVEQVNESGSGRASFEIPESGLYKFYFNGSVLGGDSGGYDVTYQVRWGLSADAADAQAAKGPEDRG